MRGIFGIASALALVSGWTGCSAGSGAGGGVAGGQDAAAASGGTSGASTGGSGDQSSGGAPGGGSSAGGVSGAGASSGGTSAAGAAGGGGIEDAGLPDIVFTYDAPTTEAEACAAVTVKAELVPLDLYVVLDRSGSMVNPTLGPLRWPPVRDALNAFFQSPTTKGIGIALTMFAHPTLSQCTPTSYQTPLVPMAPLPGSATGQAITLQNTMNQYAPVLGVGTPTESAMKGAVTFAKNHKSTNSTHTVAIVLATDGIPGAAGCTGETAAGTQSAIAAGFSGTPSIRTYVIGIDPTSQMSANINAWANAGGGQAFDVGTAGGSAQFLQAMKNIQGSLLGCTFAMPTTDAGIIEPSKVSVIYTPGSGSPTALPQVSSQAACSGAGWYYDNPASPKTIELCPASCTAVQADTQGTIDINLGCLGS